MASAQFTGLFGSSVQTYTVLLGGSSRPAWGGPLLAPACLLLAARGRRSASPVTGPFSKGWRVSQIRLGTTQFYSEPTQSPLVAPSSGCAYLHLGAPMSPPPPPRGGVSLGPWPDADHTWSMTAPIARKQHKLRPSIQRTCGSLQRWGGRFTGKRIVIGCRWG